MIQICPPDCPDRHVGCQGSCKGYAERLEIYHAEKKFLREQKARISDSIRGVIATLPVDKRNCHVTRDPGRSERPGKRRRR